MKKFLLFTSLLFGLSSVNADITIPQAGGTGGTVSFLVNTSTSGGGTAVDLVCANCVDISAETNLAVTAPITLTGDTVGLTQNAGTDVTADLEEETHATEHQDGGADEISVTGLSGKLADQQTPTPGATYYVTRSDTLVSGATFFVSSGTIVTGKISTLTIGTLNGVLKASTGLVSGSATTTDLPEGSNLYFTTARATNSITASSPLSNTAGNLSISNNLPGGSTSYVQNVDTLQSNTTFFVSSGTVQTVFIARSTANVMGLLKIPNQSGVNVTTVGEVAISTYAISNSSGTMMFWADQKYFVVATTGPAPQATGYVPKTTGNGGASWQPDGGGAGGAGTVTSISVGGGGLLASPSPITTSGTIYLLGGNTNYIMNQNTLQSGATFYPSSGSVSGKLDVSSITVWADLIMQRYIRDFSNNPFILFQATTSAVNFFAIQNSTTGGMPALISTGTDSNINLQLATSGLGGIVIITSSTVQQSSMNGGMIFNSVNSSSTAGDFIIKGSTDSFLFKTDAINNTVSIGSTTAFPLSKFWVTSADNQPNMTSNINAVQASITTLDTFLSFRSASGEEGSVAGTGVPGVIAFNTFTWSHYTQVLERSTLQILDLLCSTGEKIIRWPSSHDEIIDVPVGPVYNIYYKNISDIPANSLLDLREPIVIDSNFPRDDVLLDLTSQGLDFLGIRDDADPKTGFPVLNKIGSQYTFQETQRKQVTIDEAAIKSQLFQSEKCAQIKSKAAIGVYGGTDNFGRDLILSGGTGKMRVANKGRDLSIGDLLMSSDISGNVEKQDDDLIHGYSVGKVTENVLWGPGEIERIVNVIYLGG